MFKENRKYYFATIAMCRGKLASYSCAAYPVFAVLFKSCRSVSAMGVVQPRGSYIIPHQLNAETPVLHHLLRHHQSTKIPSQALVLAFPILQSPYRVCYSRTSRHFKTPRLRNTRSQAATAGTRGTCVVYFSCRRETTTLATRNVGLKRAMF